MIVAVPWDGHAEILQSLRADLAGKLVVDCVNPLGFNKQGAYALTMPEGSAAQQAAALLPESRVTAAFHHLSEPRHHPRHRRRPHPNLQRKDPPKQTPHLTRRRHPGRPPRPPRDTRRGTTGFPSNRGDFGCGDRGQYRLALLRPRAGGAGRRPARFSCPEGPQWSPGSRAARRAVAVLEEHEPVMGVAALFPVRLQRAHGRQPGEGSGGLPAAARTGGRRVEAGAREGTAHARPRLHRACGDPARSPGSARMALRPDRRCPGKPVTVRVRHGRPPAGRTSATPPGTARPRWRGSG
jgi:hypothetical protein